jgi:cytosine deaminase
VLLQARDPIEAIRLRATRLMVMRRGKVLSRCAPQQAQLTLPGQEPKAVDWMRRQAPR